MREKRCRDPNDSSFYLVRYLFCQSLWSISHNTFQVCRTSASDEILSSHEIGRIGVRLGRIWCFYFPSKKFFIRRWTLSMDLMIDSDVSMTDAFSNLLTDFGEMSSFYQYTFRTRQHYIWYDLKHPNRHISVYPFTYQRIMQGLLVFSFREACHPMVDTGPPIKTFLDLRPYFRYILLRYVLVQSLAVGTTLP